MVNHDIIHVLNRNIDYLYNSYEEFYNLILLLENKGNVYYFGGALRDYLMDKTPKDIDIITDVDLKAIERSFSKYIKYKNIFHGYSLNIKSLKVDLWNIKNTWGLKNSNLDPEFKNIPYTVFFNINSIIYNKKDCNLMYSNVFLKGIKDKKLMIILDKNPLPTLCILRSLIYFLRYEMILDENLIQYIKNWNNKSHSYEDIINLQLIRYGRVILDRNICQKLLEGICNNSIICYQDFYKQYSYTCQFLNKALDN